MIPNNVVGPIIFLFLINFIKFLFISSFEMQVIMKSIFSNVNFWYLNMLICANKKTVDYIFKMVPSKLQ